MARKNLLKGLMEGTAEPQEGDASPARVDASRPRYNTGAIGVVSKSIADLKSRSVTEIDPDLIDSGGLQDRLDAGGIDELARAIRDYGQQVPVLLRPNPENPDRFQVVYGRRRVAALRALGATVKAMVRALDDRELVIAQGQENSARKDLTFIERANFARQMRDAGYDRKVICDALHTDKTLVSRMLSVADRIPVDLIEAIGAAPGMGRDRWMKLADSLGGQDMTSEALGDTSDARFEAVMAELNAPKPPALPPAAIKATDGADLATTDRKRGKTVLTLNTKSAPGFDDWLVENLARLHRDWQNSRGQ
ncbi:plasmid partitioning protein RepB [Pseudophaeobacter sp. C1-32P7]|uniref:plasmid partitioning protein RepB n=1 Tax=Pseudophaeobacter sp. C1-32P7 TaxID=3098142 RepID=UPI0034D6AD09